MRESSTKLWINQAATNNNPFSIPLTLIPSPELRQTNAKQIELQLLHADNFVTRRTAFIKKWNICPCARFFTRIVSRNKKNVVESTIMQ